MTKQLSPAAIKFLNLPQYKFKNIIKIKEYNYYPLTSDLYFMEQVDNKYIFHIIEGNYYLVDNEQEDIYELQYIESSNIISKDVFTVIKNTSGSAIGAEINVCIKDYLPNILNLMKDNLEFKNFISKFKLLSQCGMNILCDSIYENKYIVNSKEFIINEGIKKQVLYVLIKERNTSNYYVEIFERYLNETIWSNKYDFIGYRNIKELFDTVNNDSNICSDILKKVLDIGNNNDDFIIYIKQFI
jgi:hypothetical protein